MTSNPPALIPARPSARTRLPLQSNAGAFDLPSILVGVVVVGVLTGGVLTSIFGVIPFAQDSGARQDLAALTTAEGVGKAKDSRFATAAALGAAGYLPEPPARLAADTDAPGSCFVGVAKSASGKIFANSSSRPTPFELSSSTLTGCITREQLKALVTGVGGFSDGNTVEAGPIFNTVTWKKGAYGGPDALDRVAVSADGKKIISSDFAGHVYVSTNSGGTMIEQTSLGTGNWNAVGISQDGDSLVAVAWNGAGNVVASSSDGGTTWSKSETIPDSSDGQWDSVAMSADASRLVVGSLGGSVFTSTDSGATWVKQAALGQHYWSNASMSGDGSRITLVGDDKLTISTDGGASWGQKDLPGYVSRLTQSADGTKMAATRFDGVDGYTWTSSDSGTTWIPRAAIGSGRVAALVSSADGLRMVATTDDFYGRVYTSGDGGATWTEQAELGSSSWVLAASSADGATIFVGNNTSEVFTGTWGP